MAQAAISSQTGEATMSARKAAGFSAVPVVALGWSLSVFFSLSFVLCVLGYFLLPSLPIAHGALTILLPGLQLDRWSRLLLGLAESFAWGWYVALVFGSLYNFFAARSR